MNSKTKPDDYGELIEPTTLRIQRLLPGPIERIWAYLTDSELRVSRRHAVITCREGEVVLLDDRSMNGVHVNGERVGQATLRDGDAIALGDVEMRFLVVA